MRKIDLATCLGLGVLVLQAGCLSPEALSLGARVTGNGPVVRFDPYHKPFAEIPLPNDFATTFDEGSPTKRRLNASIVAGSTQWERSTRAQLDKLSGWGTLAPITASFSAPIDPEVILKRHYNDRLDFSDDAVLVLNVTPGSPGFCEAVPLDLGQGNYPQVIAQQDLYDADPRASLQTAVFEEIEEDLNGNGILDPGEDTDMDGVLDHPNTRDGKPGSERLEFYERETNTLIMKPIMPMREETTYAAVLTRRLTSPAGDAIRSPFDGINDAAQTRALEALPDCLTRYGLGIEDVGFTWSFTTQSISHDYKQVRDGLHGQGVLAQLGTDFPAQLSVLNDLRDPAAGVTNTQLVPADVFVPLMVSLLQLSGSSAAELSVLTASMRSVDFVVAGEVKSPQLFPRYDEHGALLPLYEQVWDLAAAPRTESVPFWLFVPKNRTGSAPVAIFIHGHGGSKFDAAPFAGVLASFGIATLGFDAPSHGVALPDAQLATVKLVFQNAGLSGLGDRLLKGRAIDWNADGRLDSGADYWTSYVFHTRDMVRQTMVDTMQIVRTLRAFDGVTRWAFDPAHKGTPGLAGDFDGDGIVDVGGKAPLHVLGGSLGGITGGVAAGVEPELDSVVSIVPGGMLSEIGTRSTLSGVKNAIMLRVLGPIFYAEEGKLMMRVNDAESESVALEVQALPTLSPQDTVVLLDKQTGEYRCAAVQPSGVFRVTVSSDAGDPLELRVYKGVLPPRTPEGCQLPDTAPYVDLTSFGVDVMYDGRTFPKGSPLLALADGFGQRRGTPDLRRFFGVAQIAFEPADPMNWAPYWDGTRTLTYGTGETTRTNVLLMPSTGDPGVMIAAGVALGRGAGFIPYDHDDPRWGKSANQALIDTFTIEGTVRLAHFRDSKGTPVLMDVEHLAAVVPVDDGLDVPRLDPPLRLMRQNTSDGSWSGFIMPMLSPQGKHGFIAPDPALPFDFGTYALNIVGRYLQSSGKQFSWDKCQVTSTCAWPTLPLK